MRPGFIKTIVAGLCMIIAVIALTYGCSLLNRPAEVSPTAAAARAVMLVPGYGGDATSLNLLKTTLQARGLDVRVLDIADGSADINSYAANLAQQAADLGGIDVIGYSEGGLIARAAVAKNPAAFHRVVTLGTPHHGTLLAGLARQFAKSQCPASCQQMDPDSTFLAELPVASDANRWLSIYSANDDVIRPADSSNLEGASNLELARDCSVSGIRHGELPGQQATINAAVAFLASGAISC